MKVIVSLCGCDDTTCFDVEVDQDKLEFLKELAKKSQNESDYACMPILEYKIVN